jgi:hypothetical protein
VSQPFGVGGYACPRLNLVAKGKALRTRGQGFKPDLRNSAVRHYRGGLGKRGHGGIANPPCNRKGESGNPPPKAHASEFYRNHHPAKRRRKSGCLCKGLRQIGCTASEKRATPSHPRLRTPDNPQAQPDAHPRQRARACDTGTDEEVATQNRDIRNSGLAVAPKLFL